MEDLRKYKDTKIVKFPLCMIFKTKGNYVPITAQMIRRTKICNMNLMKTKHFIPGDDGWL